MRSSCPSAAASFATISMVRLQVAHPALKTSICLAVDLLVVFSATVILLHRTHSRPSNIVRRVPAQPVASSLYTFQWAGKSRQPGGASDSWSQCALLQTCSALGPKRPVKQRTHRNGSLLLDDRAETGGAGASQRFLRPLFAQRGELGAQSGELRQAMVDAREFRVDQLQHLFTRLFTSLTDRKDFPNFLQG